MCVCLDMPRKKGFQHRKKKERQLRQCHQQATQAASENSDIRSGADNSLSTLSDVSLPNSSWVIQESPGKKTFCKLVQADNSIASSSAPPVSISHSLSVFLANGSWILYVFNHRVDPSTVPALSHFPSHPDSEQLNSLLNKIDGLPICCGQSDSQYIEMLNAKKGRILSVRGDTSAYLDNGPLEINGKTISQTIRSSKCKLLGSSCCCYCKKYLKNLREIYRRWSKRSVGSPGVCANERYMTTPQKKAKMSKLRYRARTAETEILRLNEKISKLTATQGEVVDGDLHSDLIAIMHENSEKIKTAYPEGSFSRLFWDQQLKMASQKNPRQMRWHPVLIKWCIHLKLLSSASYHALRTSGFIALPSERTLRDYTNYFASKPGFQVEVLQQLQKEVESLSLPDSRKFAGIIIDEMKIKEGIVYNKHTGAVIGFTNLGDVNDSLLQMEREDEHPAVAKYVLVLMVRGLLFDLRFPLAHFGTQGVTAELLHPLVWEAIRLLELSGLKVLSVTADGASPNRKFFRMHKTPGATLKVVYKTRNHYSSEDPGRWLFFFADPPHLLKTVRNCLSHSGANGTRRLKVRYSTHVPMHNFL